MLHYRRRGAVFHAKAGTGYVIDATKGQGVESVTVEVPWAITLPATAAAAMRGLGETCPGSRRPLSAYVD